MSSHRAGITCAIASALPDVAGPKALDEDILRMWGSDDTIQGSLVEVSDWKRW